MDGAPRLRLLRVMRAGEDRSRAHRLSRRRRRELIKYFFSISTACAS
jgi:hypothetical protein